MQNLALSGKLLFIFSALSFKQNNGEIRVVTGLEKIEPKTKIMAQVIKKLSFDSKKRKYGVILDVYCELDTQMISLKHSGGERDIPSNSILLRPANLLEKSTKFKRLKKLSQIVDD